MSQRCFTSSWKWVRLLYWAFTAFRSCLIRCFFASCQHALFFQNTVNCSFWSFWRGVEEFQTLWPITGGLFAPLNDPFLDVFGDLMGACVRRSAFVHQSPIAALGKPPPPFAHSTNIAAIMPGCRFIPMLLSISNDLLPDRNLFFSTSLKNHAAVWCSSINVYFWLHGPPLARFGYFAKWTVKSFF